MRKKAVLALVFLLVAAVSAEGVSSKAAKRVEELKQSAVELIKKGKNSEAISLLKEILSLDPKDKTASRYLLLAEQQRVEPYCKAAAESYLSGDFTTATEQWQLGLAINPNDMRIIKLIEDTISKNDEKNMDSMYAVANKFFKEEKYEIAIIELNKILLVRPNDKHARELLNSAQQSMINAKVKGFYEIADSYIKEGKHELAIEEWRKILSVDDKQELASRLIASTIKTRFDSIYAKAKQLYITGDYISSREQYYQIMSENPTDQDVKKIINRLNEIITLVIKINEQGLVWETLRKGLAHHIAIDGNPRVALVAAWYAVQLEPENTVALAIRDFLERTHIAVIRTMEYPVRDMNIFDQYLFAALNHIYEGRYDLAVQMCNLLLELQPRNLLALKRLGSAYFAMGKKKDALEVWKRALEIAPDDKELEKFIRQIQQA